VNQQINGDLEMTLSKESRKIITDELTLVADNMDKSESVIEKLYYYSAAHSMIQRVLNIEYEPELIFIFLILHETYTALNSRIQAIKRGDSLVTLEEEHFTKLAKYTRDLARMLKMKKDVTNTLKKFSLLSYSATGNGYYLVKKGLLKF
jgi:hypothetical protein